MNMKTIPGKALFILVLITFTCSQVSAYSAEAANLYTSGRTLTESGDYTGAVSVLNQAITLEPAYYEAWNGLADALNRDGKFNDALAASNRSLEINPDYVQGWINRGQILYNIGYYYEDVVGDRVKADALYAEQLGAFEKAVSLDPNNAEAWFNKGYALAGMKRYDEAIVAFDRVRVIDPSYPNLVKNREIAVLLRDKTTPATTGTIATITSPPVVSATRSPQPTATSGQSTPLPGETAIFALLGAVFLILPRK
jgi:tetratricopeptide (TPR) repeat protein